MIAGAARGLLRRLAAGLALLFALSFAMLSPVAAQPLPGHVVRFAIDLRELIRAGRFDPAQDRLGLRGSQAPLSWSKSLLATAAGDGLYVVEVPFERLPFGGQPLQYKLRIERPGQGPDDGWEAGRNHPLVVDVPRLEVARRFGAEPAVLPPRRTGRIEPLGVVASAHVRPRPVQVWLPPGYGDDPARRHPVLYLHDGQNVFDARAAGAEWMVDETAQRLVQAGAIEPPIIVAVDSTPERFTDYTPTAMTLPAERTGTGQAQRVGGGAAAYARFLVEELKPQIDRRFRTRPDAASTAVGGSSLGGLVSLWLALEYPGTFGAALVVSPSLWWDDPYALRLVQARGTNDASRPRLWLDMGALEGEGAFAASRRLQQALMASGYSARTLAYVEDPHGSHDEASWAARVEGMLRFLYGPLDRALHAIPRPSAAP